MHVYTFCVYGEGELIEVSEVNTTHVHTYTATEEWEEERVCLWEEFHSSDLSMHLSHYPFLSLVPMRQNKRSRDKSCD